MFKQTITIISLAMLAACNTASLSYAPDRFQSMGSAEFSTYMQTVEGGTTDQYGRTMPMGHTKYSGPRMAFFLGTNGNLEARRTPDGKVKYMFNVVLEYRDEYIRRYDLVTDVSGTKLPFKTNHAREANGGYMREYLTVTLTEAQLNEAKFDGLFLTFSAKDHEKKVARNNRGRSLSLGEILALANEAKGGSNVERKNNDNYDLTVPAGYVRNFLMEVNS